MKVIFRVDASREIGTGHVVRCLTLADKLREFDCDITFMSRELPGNMNAEIEQARFPVRREEALGESEWDWLVIDRYHLDRNYEASARLSAKRILVIDDLANRAHDCDLLLDQNLYDDMKTRYSGLVPGNCQTLTGPRYSLLRTEFSEARLQVSRGDELRRLLVFFGGSDPTNETMKVMKAIGKFDRAGLAVDVLVGLSNPFCEELEAIVQLVPNVALHKFTNRISELMLKADLAIGGGGATSWERCCLGLPSVTIAIAENQVELSQALADNGYQIYLGESESVTEKTVIDALDRCIFDFSGMAAMGRKGMELVDGKGADRVVSAMRSI